MKILGKWSQQGLQISATDNGAANRFQSRWGRPNRVTKFKALAERESGCCGITALERYDPGIVNCIDNSNILGICKL